MSSESNARMAQIAERLRSLTGGEKGGKSEEIIPWEDEMTNVLRDGADKVGIDFITEKKRDSEGNRTITYTRGMGILTLTMHLDNFDVGEKTGSFYFSVPKEEYDKADWFRTAFEKMPVELHTIEKTDSGEVERVIYP